MGAKEIREGMQAVGNKATGTGYAIPPVLNDVFTLAKNHLEDSLQVLFDEADSALFDMAERAQINTDQNMYFESMRALRLERRAVAMHFTQEFSSVWNAVMAGKKVPRPRYYSTDNLALIEKNELEEIVAIESMVARVASKCNDELSLLSLRVERVLPGRSIDNDQNPLAPVVLCNSFAVACEDLAIELKGKLFFYKLFEKQVVDHFYDLYVKANAAMAAAGVLPNVKLVDLTKKTRPESVRKSSSSNTQLKDSGGVSSDQVFQELRQLIRQKEGPRTAESRYHNDGAVSVLRHSSLVQILVELQRPRRGLKTDESGYIHEIPPQENLQDLVLGLAQAGNPDREQLAIGDGDADTIELISMLFAVVEQDRSLELPIKALLILLRIPLARLALRDKSLFSKKSHPARRLMDEVGLAALGWRPGSDASRDFLYRKVREVVEFLIEDYSEEAFPFQQALDEFMSYREAEVKRTAAMERRSLDTQLGKIQGEAVQHATRTHLKSRLDEALLPAALLQMLNSEWAKLITTTALQEGIDSENVLSALRVVDDLIWSLAPKVTGSERQRLTRLRPILHRSLYTGLSRVGMSHFSMSRFFNRLDDYLDEAMTGKVNWQKEEPQVATQATQGRTAYLSNPQVVAQVRRLRKGNWVEFHTDNINRRHRLAAIVEPPGTYVFVDRAGRVAQELDGPRLAELLLRKKALILDDRLLFERSLAQIRGLLQSQQSAPTGAN